MVSVQNPNKTKEPPRPKYEGLQNRIRGYSSNLHIKGLLFGPSRAGKTHFLATAGQDERTAPALIIDFEDGGITAQGAPGIEIFRARDWQDYNEVHGYLASGASPYKTCSIDSVSESHIYSQLYVVDSEIKKGNTTDRNFIEQRHYGISLTMMRRFLREFRDLPMHTWFTALDKVDKEEGEGLVRKPHLSGQLSGETVGLFSVAVFLLKEKKRDEVTKKAYLTRTLILQNRVGFRTGVRSSWGQSVPNEIEEPTMAKLLDALSIPK